MNPPPGETCEVCTRPSPMAALCPDCTRRLRSWFRDLVGHAADLNLVVSKQTSPGGERVKVRGKGESPMVWDEDAGRVAGTLHNTLVAIVRDLEESRGYDYLASHKLVQRGFIGPLLPHWRQATPGDVSSRMIAHWLAWNVQSIALAPGAGQTYDEVRYLAANGSGSDDQRPIGIVVNVVDIHLSRILIGRCDGAVDGMVCGDDLRVRDAEETTVVCKGCGTVHDVAEFKLRTLRSLHAAEGTAQEISDYTAGAISASTIRSWAKRGKVERVNLDGPPRYRIGEVLAQWQRMKGEAA